MRHTKKCCICGVLYGWEEWGKHLYARSNMCYRCREERMGDYWDKKEVEKQK